MCCHSWGCLLLVIQVVEHMLYEFIVSVIFSSCLGRAIVSNASIYDPCWIILLSVVYVLFIVLCSYMLGQHNYIVRILYFCCRYMSGISPLMNFTNSELQVPIKSVQSMIKCIYYLHLSFTPVPLTCLSPASWNSINVLCLIIKCPDYVDTTVKIFKNKPMSPLIDMVELQPSLFLSEKLYCFDFHICAKAYVILQVCLPGYFSSSCWTLLSGVHLVQV